MFNLNFISFPKFRLGLVINYYPLFNLITAGIQLITLKNNILQAMGTCCRDFMEKIDYNKMVKDYYSIKINLEWNKRNFIKFFYFFFDCSS